MSQQTLQTAAIVDSGANFLQSVGKIEREYFDTPTPEAVAEREARDALRAKLDARRFRVKKMPMRPVPLFRIAEQPIATRGNIQAIQAQAKAGKTAILGAMIAAWMKPGEEFLGVSCDAHFRPMSGALVHMDSEQSEFDHWRIGGNAVVRAGRTEEPEPENFRSFNVTELTLQERKDGLRMELEDAKVACGSIFAVFIDGLADLCMDPNDSEEAFSLVAEMHRLAIQYDTAIFCVLHENEGSQSDKMRGHLGSQLARKAETNLRLKKDADDVTTVFTGRSRNCSIRESEGPRFAWDDEKRMHMPFVSGAKKEAKAQERIEELRACVEDMFYEADAGGMRRCDMVNWLTTNEKLSASGARERITKMLAAKLIQKAKTGDKYIATNAK